MTQYVNISTRHRWHSFLASIAKPPLKYTFDSNDLHFQDKKPKKNKKNKKKQTTTTGGECVYNNRPTELHETTRFHFIEPIYISTDNFESRVVIS